MSFEVEIELSKKNYFEYYFFDECLDIKSKTIKVLLFLLFIYASVKVGTIVFGYILFLILVLGGGIAIFITFYNYNKDANRLINDGFNKQKLIFDEDKWFVEDRMDKAEYKASAILEAAETKKYVFLYLTKHVAWIVPKSQLSESQYNDIISFLKNNNIAIKNYSWC